VRKRYKLIGRICVGAEPLAGMLKRFYYMQNYLKKNKEYRSLD